MQYVNQTDMARQWIQIQHLMLELFSMCVLLQEDARKLLFASYKHILGSCGGINVRFSAKQSLRNAICFNTNNKWCSVNFTTNYLRTNSQSLTQNP